MKPFNAVGSEEGDANDSGEEKHVSEEVLRQEQDQPGPTWWGRGRGPGTGGAGHGKRSTCLLLLPLPRLRTAARWDRTLRACVVWVRVCLCVRVISEVLKQERVGCMRVCGCEFYILVRTGIVKKSINNKFWRVCGKKGNLVVKNPPAKAGDLRDMLLIPGSGRSPGGGCGNPLQDSCLETPMDREAWWATVHRAAKSQIPPKWFSTVHSTMRISMEVP